MTPSWEWAYADSGSLLPDGRTVGETVIPHIDEAYRTGKMPPMLGMGS